MKFASKVLHVDGYLLQFDTIGCGEIGDIFVMQSYYADDNLLKLKYDYYEFIPPDDHRKRKNFVWKKKAMKQMIIVYQSIIFVADSCCKFLTNYNGWMWLTYQTGDYHAIKGIQKIRLFISDIISSLKKQMNRNSI